ncbi:MAG: hypothetical protein H6581_19440 [Bacteroidia bacterium]|nr:hypothetical protein [Bacteroidia bacterium]
MKPIILIILLCTSTFGSRVICQSFDTLATRHYPRFASQSQGQLNRVDEKGRRSGLWITYRMETNCRPSGLSTEKSDTCFFLSSKGNYYEGEKIGLWEYYHDEGCSFETIRTETFPGNGSVIEFDYFGKWEIRTHYSSDSNRVTSDIRYRFPVKIDCSNKTSCEANSQGQGFLRFDYSRLAFEQMRIVTGEYDIILKQINEK